MIFQMLDANTLQWNSVRRQRSRRVALCIAHTSTSTSTSSCRSPSPSRSTRHVQYRAPECNVLALRRASRRGPPLLSAFAFLQPQRCLATRLVSSLSVSVSGISYTYSILPRTVLYTQTYSTYSTPIQVSLTHSHAHTLSLSHSLAFHLLPPPLVYFAKFNSVLHCSVRLVCLYLPHFALSRMCVRVLTA